MIVSVAGGRGSRIKELIKVAGRGERRSSRAQQRGEGREREDEKTEPFCMFLLRACCMSYGNSVAPFLLLMQF